MALSPDFRGSGYAFTPYLGFEHQSLGSQHVTCRTTAKAPFQLFMLRAPHVRLFCLPAWPRSAFWQAQTLKRHCTVPLPPSPQRRGGPVTQRPPKGTGLKRAASCKADWHSPWSLRCSKGISYFHRLKEYSIFSHVPMEKPSVACHDQGWNTRKSICVWDRFSMSCK